MGSSNLVLLLVMVTQAFTLIACDGGNIPNANMQNSIFYIDATKSENVNFHPIGEWGYAWPHNIMPREIEGMVFVSGPIDESIPHEGRVSNNWNQPMVFRDPKNDVLIQIWCARDFERTPVVSIGQDQWGVWENTQFEEVGQVDFDLPHLAVQASSSNTSAKDDYTFLLLLRDGGNLFRVQAGSSDLATAREAAILAGHHIASWRLNN